MSFKFHFDCFNNIEGLEVFQKFSHEENNCLLIGYFKKWKNWGFFRYFAHMPALQLEAFKLKNDLNAGQKILAKKGINGWLKRKFSPKRL